MCFIEPTCPEDIEQGIHGRTLGVHELLWNHRVGSGNWTRSTWLRRKHFLHLCGGGGGGSSNSKHTCLESSWELLISRRASEFYCIAHIFHHVPKLSFINPTGLWSSEFCVIARTASYGQVVYDSILDRSAKTAGFKFDPTKQQPGVPSAWQLKSWVMMCSFVQNWNIECVEMCVKNWGQQKHTCCILQFHTSMQHVFWEGDLGCLHFFDKTTFLVNRDHPFRGSCIIFIRMCGAECFP